MAELSASAFDSLVGHTCAFTIDGVETRVTTEIGALKFSQDIVELDQITSDGKVIKRKMLGPVKGGEITVTRPFTDKKEWEDWVFNARKGMFKNSIKTAEVVFYDYLGAPMKRYKLLGCLPKDLEISGGNPKDAKPATEKITISFTTAEAG